MTSKGRTALLTTTELYHLDQACQRDTGTLRAVEFDSIDCTKGPPRVL